MNHSEGNDVLRESEERLRLAFWAANIGFWSWDLLTHEVYLSPIWKSQLGYDDHELPNAFSTWEELLHPEDREASWKVIQEAQQDPQRIFEMYFRLRHKNQAYRWLLSRGRVYRDTAGKPIRIMGCHVDVTHQKEDEQLLRRSESQLQTALEGGRMGTWVWDLESNRTQWNRREYELLDIPYHPERSQTQDFFERVHPEDRASLQEQINLSIQTKRQFFQEFRVVRSDGSICWLVGAGRTVLDPRSGKPTQMVGVNYDITATKQAHQSLQEAHEFIKQIIINAEEGIIVYDRQLRYQLWNPFMERLTGFTEADVLGKSPVELFPFLHEQGIDGLLQRALQGEIITGKDMHYQFPEQNKKGWTTARYGPLRDSQGNITGVIATIRDTTERKKVEEKLYANQQRLELILQQLPSILWTTDRNLRFTSISGSSLKSIGLETDSSVGQSIQEFMGRNYTTEPAVSAHQQAVLGKSVAFEQDFKQRTFQAHIEPLRNAHGVIQGCIGVALDITDRKKQEQHRQQLEQRIQQAQKLESLEVLAGGIAHDFNNLLTGMLGYASLALIELPETSPVHSMIKEIEKAAQRAADLSRQMLAYSGKGKFVIEVIALDQLVTEMVGLMKTVVSSKAQLHVDAQPACLEGDATQIRQVVMNLITNAVDSVQGDGFIAIRTGVKTCSAKDLQGNFGQEEIPPGDYAFLEIQDNGCGIAPEVLSKIFDPFFTTKFTGRGLGLASVLGIVRGHRGSVQVESQLAQGTLFRLLFPLASCRPVPIRSVAPSAQIHQHSGKILIVEDDDSVVRIVKIVMEKAGYQLMVVPDSRNVRATLEQAVDPLLAAVIDYTMPSMNGLELAAQLHTSHPDLPILLMSGFAEEDIASQLRTSHIKHFLQKPFRAQDLLSSVAKLLKR